MPLVNVRYNLVHHGNVLKQRVVETLGDALAIAVASNFDCPDPGGELTAEDVEVFFTAASPFDKSDFQVVIDVEAKHFPSRHDNKQERTDALCDDIRQMLPAHVSFGLWVKLNNAAWADSPGGTSVRDGLQNLADDTAEFREEPEGSFPGHHTAHSLS